MFTGIIESTGIVREVIAQKSNIRLWIESPVSQLLKIDQSVSHNGICLTVDDVRPGLHHVTAIEETISKTTIGNWAAGDIINLEQCLQLNGRIDGHIVQGHVDCTAECTGINEKDGSWEYTFRYPPQFAHLVIEKGSICLNGISLTVYNLRENYFSAAIIPYTFENTNMQYVKAGNKLNIEFDVVGKYISRALVQNKP